MKRFLELIDKYFKNQDVFVKIDSSRRQFIGALAALSCAAALGLKPKPATAASSRIIARRLEKKIERYIKALRQAGIIPRNEKTAWSVYDFTLDRKLVSINENTPYQSASMIKPFIALAFFYKVRENTRKYRYDRRAKAKMVAMIKRSDNSATNFFIDLIGGKRGGPREVERTLKKYAPGVFRQTRIVERIPRGGRTYRNKASARDYSRFLYAIWYDKFPFSRELKQLMGLPNRDRIYNGADKIPPGTMVYDKTGTTARLCGDMGILVAKGKDNRRYPYTFIGIIEKSKRTKSYGRWAASRGDIIREVSNIVYTELQKIHNLV